MSRAHRELGTGIQIVYGRWHSTDSSRSLAGVHLLAFTCVHRWAPWSSRSPAFAHLVSLPPFTRTIGLFEDRLFSLWYSVYGIQWMIFNDIHVIIYPRIMFIIHNVDFTCSLSELHWYQWYYSIILWMLFTEYSVNSIIELNSNLSKDHAG